MICIYHNLYIHIILYWLFWNFTSRTQSHSPPNYSISALHFCSFPTKRNIPNKLKTKQANKPPHSSVFPVSPTLLHSSSWQRDCSVSHSTYCYVQSVPPTNVHCNDSLVWLSITPWSLHPHCNFSQISSYCATLTQLPFCRICHFMSSSRS